MTKDLIAPGFRGDINGLRAWAVIAVILYHFGVPGFDGGFVGVDVFFVISGFLMTGIVLEGLERGSFSLAAFYLARARRILPALIGLCAALLVLGWLMLPSLDFETLGRHAVFSVSFLSNIKFWREAGYFDAASHEKWLLHTWSLSVEWQFYLLLPLLLLAVWKWRPGHRPIMVVMAIGLLVSLASSVVITPLRPIPAFYLLPTRAWEMLAGGVVYLLSHRLVLTARQRIELESVGLVLVMGSIAGFDASSPWPGWRALVPVAGTAGMLLAARSGSLWTGRPVAQWLGTRSYSLYLWHWPVVVALTHMELQSNPTAIAVGLLLTLLLGHFSYRMLELAPRLHLAKMRLGKGAAVLMGCAIAVVVLPGAFAYLNQGVPGRFSPEIEAAVRESLNGNPRSSECLLAAEGDADAVSPSCMFGGSRLKAVVFGDSHANALVTGVAAAVNDSTDGVMEWAYAGCPVIQGAQSSTARNWGCGRFTEWVFTALKAIPDNIPLVIINRDGQYARGPNESASTVNIPQVYFSKIYKTTDPEFINEYSQKLTEKLCRLAESHPVFVVRPIPEMGVIVPNKVARALIWGRAIDVSITLEEYHQRNDFVWKAQNTARDRCGVKILDPLPYLCSDGRCHGTKNKKPLYQDDDHLSEYGNKLLVPMFREVFKSQGQRENSSAIPGL